MVPSSVDRRAQRSLGHPIPVLLDREVAVDIHVDDAPIGRLYARRPSVGWSLRRIEAATAYSGAIRPGVPVQSGHPFRLNPAKHSG